MPDITKLEWFAGMAMQGFIAAHSGDGVTLPDFAKAALESVGYADALLAELAKCQTNPELGAEPRAIHAEARR